VCSGQGSRKESRKGKWRNLERKEKKQKQQKRREGWLKRKDTIKGNRMGSERDGGSGRGSGNASGREVETGISWKINEKGMRKEGEKGRARG
jgi:hypothetical protein